nr:MAG TPA: hypothetical protein [Caudoviricetes sp.]
MFLLCQNGIKSLTFHFQYKNTIQNGKFGCFFHLSPEYDVKRLIFLCLARC